MIGYRKALFAKSFQSIGNWNAPTCRPGPVRVALTIDNGDVSRLETSVSGAWPRATEPWTILCRCPRVTDLGTITSSEAAAYFFGIIPQLERSGPGRDKSRFLLPAVLADDPKANVVLFRGFDTHRELPGFDARFGLRAAAVAIYPMYRGIARLLGMDVLGRPADLTEQLAILRESWNDYDYFFLHHKYTDSAGEDGDRARKIAAIENLDAVVPELRALSPDVIAVSGDHSTPSQMAAHSWHPVPTLLWSERCGRDDVEQFGERWCRHGALGIRPTKDLMAFMLANAGRLAKYGA